jgi:drug/metabolite transporter (DMT)-like permease
VIVWGGSFVATKVALQYIHPVTVVWLRFGIGVLILGAAVALRRQFMWPEWREWLFRFARLLGITFHQWLQSTGLLTAQATTTAWIVATTPIFMACSVGLFQKGKLGRTQVGAFAGGAGRAAGGQPGQSFCAAGRKLCTPGDLLVMISAPNWAVFSALSRRGLQRHPVARMMFFVMGFGWLFSSLFFFSGPGLGDVPKLAWDGWLAIAFLGVLCSGVAYIFWYDALQALPVAQAGAFVYLEPFVTVGGGIGVRLTVFARFSAGRAGIHWSVAGESTLKE